MNSTVTNVTLRDVSHRLNTSPYRDKRDTTLWGVTFVTLIGRLIKVIPISLFQSGGGTAQAGGVPISPACNQGTGVRTTTFKSPIQRFPNVTN